MRTCGSSSSRPACHGSSRQAPPGKPCCRPRCRPRGCLPATASRQLAVTPRQPLRPLPLPAAGRHLAGLLLAAVSAVVQAVRSSCGGCWTRSACWCSSAGKTTGWRGRTGACAAERPRLPTTTRVGLSVRACRVVGRAGCQPAGQDRLAAHACLPFGCPQTTLTDARRPAPTTSNSGGHSLAA